MASQVYEFQDCKGFGSKKLFRISKSLIDATGLSKYWAVNHVPKFFPKITGFPSLSFETHRPYTLHTRSGFQFRIKVAPKKCYLGRIINYPFQRLGAPQIKIIGAKGGGKSNLLNLILALWAAKGLEILTFNDRRMEIRSLAAHGWFDGQDSFHPFEIEIFIPKGYVFKEANPIWEYYPNVTKVEYTHVDEILKAMKPHKIVVVHEEVFTPESKLRLWNDCMEYIAESVDSKRVIAFAHHELSRLIPETPSEEVNKLVKRASDNLANFRKDKIGLLTSFHMDSEVFYRVVQKMGIKIQKIPLDKNRYNRIEKEALSYTIKDFAVKREGRGWMKHSMEMYPELPDNFRLVPKRRKLHYPSFEYEELDNDPEQVIKELTPQEQAYELFPQLYRRYKDIKIATKELYKLVPELRPTELGEINGLGDKANKSLRGKAYLELLESENSSEEGGRSITTQKVTT